MLVFLQLNKQEVNIIFDQHFRLRILALDLLGIIFIGETVQPSLVSGRAA